MSSSDEEVVRITTGTWESSGSDLIFSRICRPSYLGRLRSSRIRSTSGAPACAPRRYRKSRASSPSRATCSRLRILLSSNASRVISSSPGSSSTSRTSIGCRSHMQCPSGDGAGALAAWLRRAARARAGGGDNDFGITGRGGGARGGRRGQGEVDARPALVGGVQEHLAAVLLDDPLAQREADPGARVRVPPVQPLEDNEDLLG